MLLTLAAMAFASAMTPAPAPALVESAFASCYILFRPSNGTSIAYLSGTFPSSLGRASNEHQYLDTFVNFLASKYPSNGAGTVQAACNFATSAPYAQQMSEYVVGPANLNANSVVHTGWHP